MANRGIRAAVAAACCGLAVGTVGAVEMKTDIDWPAFLGRHDLVWNRMPKGWLEAPFLGNGMMGTMVRQTGDRTVRWDVGRGDVQDHRPVYDGDLKNPTMFARCRLPIGYFDLETVGKVTGGTMRLDLWNAEATGEIVTGKGSVRWRSLVPADRMVILAEIEPSAGERGCRWQWHALPAISPRYARGNKWEGYQKNPPPAESQAGDVHLCTQPLLSGGETVTAWTVTRTGGAQRLTVGVAHSFPDKTARGEAVAAVEAAAAAPMDQLVERHRAWWHAFYPGSFLSLPDTKWESFYWIQIYKLASATRADRMLLDLAGPWLQPTPWPGVWWDLNVQLTYWPTYASNRLGLGSSLGRHLYAHVQELIDTVPEPCRKDSAAVTGATGQDGAGSVSVPDGTNAPMPGLLLWGLHNCWLHYRFSMDDETLRNDLYPLLKRAVNYYFHFLTRDESGVLHIPRTFSPEYKAGKGPDTNFELALLRWGCTALIQGAGRLGIDDPLLPKWRDTLAHLADYPVNENGYMIAAGVPFATRHRHFSHLLMLYPLYLVNADQPGAEALAMKSLEHWQHYHPGNGYSFTGGASIAAAFGHGNEALGYLDRLPGRCSPTTMYSEAGGAPVIESPLSGAQSILDMVIQSWGNTIRVFPAAPDAWGDVVFNDLRAEGAFLVSAVRKGGRTQWVRVKSLAGEPCRIRPGLEGTVRVSGDRAFSLKQPKPGLYELDLKKGEEAVLWSGDRVPELRIAPEPAQEGRCNAFGLK